MTSVSSPSSSHQSAAESPAGPAPMMMTSCMGPLDDDLRRLPLQRFAQLGGHLVRLKSRGGRRALVVEELDGRGQLAPVCLPHAAPALRHVQAADEAREVAARDAWAR